MNMITVELILAAILTASLAGMAIILLRKIPILVKLPSSRKESREPLVSKIKNGVRSLPGAEKLDYELYLQKLLSKIHILNLKTENKTRGWLETMRQRTVQKNDPKKDNYWEELKKVKRGK